METIQQKPTKGPIIQEKKPDWPHETQIRGTLVNGHYIYGGWIEGRTKDGKRCWT
jgi:hypothetical protein